jgi:hypothetical protein
VDGNWILHWNDFAFVLFPVVYAEIKKRELFMRMIVLRILLLVVLATFLMQDAGACAVCFGDPNSSMTHGAKAGVAVLLGVVGVVLCGIGGVTFYWIRRARLLQVQAAMRGESIEL